jgi:hypothetical protein
MKKGFKFVGHMEPMEELRKAYKIYVEIAE